MSRLKRWIVTGLVVLFVLGAGGALLFWYAGLSGSSAIESWIGQQFQFIANSYLNPQLSFDDLDYQLPYTVTLKNLRLVAQDPSNPGQSIDIIGCGQATVTLGQIPAVGKPVVIERIVLDQPLISAVATEPKSAKFIGFSTLVRGRRPGSRQTAEPATRPKLSDVFQMKFIAIQNGRIKYDPRITGTVPMELDQINTTLNIEQTEAGWYKLATEIARKPLFDLTLAGQLNLDSMETRDLNLKLSADVTRDKINYLPPQLQQILNQYEVEGVLDASVTGAVPIREPNKGNLVAQLALKNANVTLDEYRIPVQDLQIGAKLADGRLDLSTMTISALHGTASGQGSTLMSGNYDTNIKLAINNMQIQDLEAAHKDGQPMKFAGKIDVNFQASAPLKIVQAKAVPTTQNAPLAAEPLPEQWGAGTINLVDGRLVRLPVIHTLTDAISSAAKIIGAGEDYNALPRDRVHIDFNLTGDHASVSDLSYYGSAVAARGSGTIGLNRQLDLRVNGGPIEKVQDLLGKQIGGMIAKVTDSLLAYHVTGTIGKPQVDLILAGGSASKVGDVVGNGADKIGEGLQDIGEKIGDIFKPKENK
ncbi:MAG TPA: hypothetical protein VHD56_16505 [Tepidisphaeraceae bacterium]|nr:hypothetical protein [Tepidisphaeraceae bacterium]